MGAMANRRRSGGFGSIKRILLLAHCIGAALSLHAREFSLVTYNVENLFDVDGVAAYEEFTSENYTPEHLAVKVGNIAKVLARVDEGKGPDIVVFNEIELDQTPETTIRDYRSWLESVKGKKIADLLKVKPLPNAVAGIPSEAWLLKACEDAGLHGYHVATTNEKPGSYGDGRGVAIRNVVFSRFPILSTQTHPTPNARAILEVVLDVDGFPLTVLANHWKSGASDLDAEEQRIENAKSLRQRLDAIFAKDTNADVVLAGDFNSHYNQKRRYRLMKNTGINDVLRAQGNELSLRGKNSDLYNLWFELPSNLRGSDIYRGEWGTLMHIIVSRGLYDQNGVQYVDNSFSILKIPGLNADVFGKPVRWSRSKTPSGFSDHFPLFARFRTVNDGDKSRWMPLNQPSLTENGAGTPIRVENSVVDLFDTALKISDLPSETNLRDGSYDGRIFYVEAPATVDARGFVRVHVLGEDYDVFTHDRDLRKFIKDLAKTDGYICFYGELGTYKGRWQFLLHGKEWFISNVPAPYKVKNKP